MKDIFYALFSEASNFFIMDYENVSHNAHNSCVKRNKNKTWIHEKEAENTKPGPNDFRKRINKISSGSDSDEERPKYHLNNYVSLQDTRNEIFSFSLQHFPEMIMNEAPGKNNKQMND